MFFFLSVSGSGDNYTDLHIIKTKLDLDSIKSDTVSVLGSLYSETVYEAIEANNGDFIVSGEAFFATGSGRELLVCLNSNGQLKWGLPSTRTNTLVRQIAVANGKIYLLQGYGSSKLFQIRNFQGDSLSSFLINSPDDVSAKPSCFLIGENGNIILGRDNFWESRNEQGLVLSSDSTYAYKYFGASKSSDGHAVFSGTRVINDSTYLFIKKLPL